MQSRVETSALNAMSINIFFLCCRVLVFCILSSFFSARLWNVTFQNALVFKLIKIANQSATPREMFPGSSTCHGPGHIVCICLCSGHMTLSFCYLVLIAWKEVISEVTIKNEFNSLDDSE